MLSREGKQTDRGAVGAEFIGYTSSPGAKPCFFKSFRISRIAARAFLRDLNQGNPRTSPSSVHGTPEIELPPSNYDDHLVQVPAFGTVVAADVESAAHRPDRIVKTHLRTVSYEMS